MYPCHAVIVVLHIDTREQRFFLGHTDKVSTTGPRCGSRLQASQLPSTCCFPRSPPWRWTETAPCWPQPRHSPPACCASGTSRAGPACPCSRALFIPSAPSGGQGASEVGGGCSGDTDHLLYIHSLSDSGALLCGVGKDHHGRTVKGQAGEVGQRQSTKHLGSCLLPLVSCWAHREAPTPHTAECYVLHSL